MSENVNHDFLGIVCDGVGGASHGEVASSLAVRWMNERFTDTSPFLDLADAKAWLYTSIADTSRQVYEKAQNEPEYLGMGTTLVAVLVTQFGTLVANVGDSRAYGLDRHGVFRSITMDHTYVAKLVQTGQISLQEAMNHPQRHVITNAIGIWRRIDVDIFSVDEDIQMILLCSDGLHGYVREKMISAVLLQENLTLQEKAMRLIQAANETGGLDNITAVLVDLDGGNEDE